MLVVVATISFIIGTCAVAAHSEADLETAFTALLEVDKYLTYRSRSRGEFAEDMNDIDYLVNEASLDFGRIDYGLKILIDMESIKRVLSDSKTAECLMRLKELYKVLDPNPSIVCSTRVTESIKIANDYAKDPIHRLDKGKVKMGRLDYLIAEAARIQAQRCDPLHAINPEGDWLKTVKV